MLETMDQKGPPLNNWQKYPDNSIPFTYKEDVAINLYAHIDAAAQEELKRLLEKTGTYPTCTLGCYNCCGQHIMISGVEAHVLVQYIKRRFSGEQIEGLRSRTKKWHDWNNPARKLPPRERETLDPPFTLPSHYCPMLVNGTCSAYAVRPVVCRTHFVSSEPPACRSINDANYIGTAAIKIRSVLDATSPYSQVLKILSARIGSDISRTVMLLPQLLAVEMDWDFAIH